MNQGLVILISLAIVGFIFTTTFLIYNTSNLNSDYTYLGKITDISGGSSDKVLILTLDTIGKVPYTFNSPCVDKIRVGMPVYDGSEYLWVQYAPGEYC